MAMRHNQPMLILALLLILGGSAMAGGKHENDADRCVAGKLRAIGDALSCRLDEEARQIRHGKSPHFARCDHRFKKKIEKLNARFRDACPYLDDLPDLSIQNEAIVKQVYDAIEDGDYDLSVEAPTNPCVPFTDGLKYSPETWGVGAYSAQCNVMLYRASQGLCGPESLASEPNWMIPAVDGLALALASGCSDEHDIECEKFFKFKQTQEGDPSSSDEDDTERVRFLNGIFTERVGNPARVIQKFFWNAHEQADWAPRDTAKSLGAATDYGTYVGVYNCESAHQRDKIKGCGPLLNTLRPFFVGAMVNPALTIDYKPDSSDPKQRYPRLLPLHATKNDCEMHRPGKEPTKTCNFNIFKPKNTRSTSGPVDDFEWAKEITREGFFGDGPFSDGHKHPFAACDRGWYQYALQHADTASFANPDEDAKPFFKSVYQNFVTHHPIFGYVMRYKAEGSEESECCGSGSGPEHWEAEECRANQAGKGAGVVLALEYVADARAVTQWEHEPSWRGCQVECCVTPNREKDTECSKHNGPLRPVPPLGSREDDRGQEIFQSLSGPGGIRRDVVSECKEATTSGDSGANCVWQCGTPANPEFPDRPYSLDPSTL